jgi:hypothetical protein
MVRLAKQDARSAYFREHPEVEEALQGIDAEFDWQIEDTNDSIADLKKQIDDLVILHGASVKTEHLTVSYTKPSWSYPKASVDNFTLKHPELAQELASLRSERSPSVSYRWSKK